MKRSCGILQHISSLPSPFGIGDLGPGAYQFADFLQQSHVRSWQLLPLNPTDPVFGNSPYSSNSAFAGNPLFISPELLVKEGRLPAEAVAKPPKASALVADYEGAAAYKQKLFDLAFVNAQKRKDKAMTAFYDENAFWLDDYALFLALKCAHNGQLWNLWPKAIRERQPAALKKARQEYATDIARVKFLQFLFAAQFNNLRCYCAQKGVSFIGDIPIYVSFDSADVWANPELFKLNPDLSPTYVAGVPPDYFSATGQRWGNPVYDWEANKREKYAWWIQRVKQNLALFDYIRIDHFRGFAGYWQIPSAEPTAINGQWVDGPGADFFEKLRTAFPHLPIIAEDLGMITPDVPALMEKFGFPGMKILLFAFFGDLKVHPYIPENYVVNCVAYTGTHDNNTVRGWFEQDMVDEERNNLFGYLGREICSAEAPWAMIELVLRSRADLAIIPLQDFLNLGAEARMNTPAKAHGNWTWRVEAGRLEGNLAAKIRAIVQSTNRG